MQHCSPLISSRTREKLRMRATQAAVPTLTDDNTRDWVSKSTRNPANIIIYFAIQAFCVYKQILAAGRQPGVQVVSSKVYILLISYMPLYISISHTAYHCVQASFHHWLSMAGDITGPSLVPPTHSLIPKGNNSSKDKKIWQMSSSKDKKRNGGCQTPTTKRNGRCRLALKYAQTWVRSSIQASVPHQFSM